MIVLFSIRSFLWYSVNVAVTLMCTIKSNLILITLLEYRKLRIHGLHPILHAMVLNSMSRDHWCHYYLDLVERVEKSSKNLHPVAYRRKQNRQNMLSCC